MNLFDVKLGMRVAYVPTHARGDINHPDVERGTTFSCNSKYVFVKFDKHINKCGCEPGDLVEIERRAPQEPEVAPADNSASDEVMRMVFAFEDKERQVAVKRLAERVRALERFARDCMNFDCDADAHKYKTTCRACAAAALMKEESKA